MILRNNREDRGQNLKQLFNLKPPLGFELEWTVIGQFLKDKFPGDKH